MTFTKNDLLNMTDEELAKLMCVARAVREERRTNQIIALTEQFTKIWQNLEESGVTVILNGTGYSSHDVEFDY